MNYLILIFLVGCSHLFYQPDKKIYSDPDQVGYIKQETFLNSGDRKLHVWKIHSPNKKRNTLDKVLIVQFHGNAQNISSHFAALAWTAHYGATVLTFDWSGYGQSSGEANQVNLHQDAVMVLQHSLELINAGSFSKLVVFGQSLGGAVLSRAILDVDQSKIDLLVLDSTFASYQKVAKEKLQTSWITYLFSPLAYVLVSDRYASTDRLKEITAATLVIHAEGDGIVPFEMGQDLYVKLKSKKNFWKLNSRGHTSVFFEFGNLYREQFEKMIMDLPKF